MLGSRPRISRFTGGALLSSIASAAACAALASPAAAAGAFRLTATDTGSSYAPTFTGNGELGVRVPPAGQGYVGGTVPAQSELAGFYAQPAGGVQQRANIPTWSTLTFLDGGTPFSLAAGQTSGWRQTIDFRTGAVTTTARWQAPDGHVTDLRYEVLADRALPNVGLVRLTVTPQWSGTAAVQDVIDGSPANLTTQVAKGWDASSASDWVTVQTQGTGIDAALASTLAASPSVAATAPTPLDASTDQSVGQRLTFPVSAGHTYTFTKYVGVESSQDAADPATAQTGFASLRRANDAAWSALWAGRIDVLGNRTLATEVNASQFYLWSSTRAGVDWSVSPAGLSSNGYNGHIFWDAETWMYPSLLAQHPDIAVGMDDYRFDRLGEAEEHATATGFAGARFPWESALDGTEQIPPPESVNSEGLYEQHITADIALAQWQYYLATGDASWLKDRGWPVISGAATFWASRAQLGSDGKYHIDNVTGPDEENPDVGDEVYTNVAAATTLRDAVQAAQVVGASSPASWSQIAANMYVPTANGIHPELSGYQGQMVKQADVTLLQYPWAYPMSAGVAQNDLDYYVPRSDPGGPSMSDAVNSIDTSALGSPGCASYVYTERSIEPFIRDVFDQFSETKTGGAFTFMTGIGGFLQEFLYGYSGLRFDALGVQLAPSLSGGIGGIVLHQLRWQGRTFNVAIGRRGTIVTLLSGPALPVSTPAGARSVSAGSSIALPTARPDLTPTSDAVRCGTASASSAQPGAPALAAVDGSPATDWQAVSLPATLTVPVSGGSRQSGGGAERVSTATLRWGSQWPPPPKTPNVPPPPGPVKVARATDYTLQVSSDGRRWQTVATLTDDHRGNSDVLHFAPVRARFVRVAISAATLGTPPMLDELTIGP
jgi:trehalose/maltose hydrolase-like predicted phosphorylase